MYYFGDDGVMKTGKITTDDANDDSYNFYFYTTNANYGEGFSGEKDGYLYQMGQRLEAQDDYAIYQYGTSKYVVNTNGKIQKSTSKKYKLDADQGYVTVDSDGKVDKYYATKDATGTTTLPSSVTINKGGLYSATAPQGYKWEG